MVRTGFAWALFAMAVSVGSTVSAQQETVNFGCDGPAGVACNFTVRPAAGAERKFVLKGGEKDRVAGLVPGKDNYCVCVGIPTPADWGQCKRLAPGAAFCKTATVVRGYNN